MVNIGKVVLTAIFVMINSITVEFKRQGADIDRYSGWAKLCDCMFECRVVVAWNIGKCIDFSAKGCIVKMANTLLKSIHFSNNNTLI